MRSPDLQEEKKLWRRGYRFVAGLDEAGRGALAGPVVAAAVAITTAKFKNQNSKFKMTIQNLKLRDSKQLAPLQREKLYKAIVKSPDLEWGIGKVSNKTIDRINILEATKLAMEKAIENLEKKLKKLGMIDFLLLDGKMRLNLPIPQKSIVKADEKVVSCALAAILAKVTRDRLMRKYHQRYPQYRFDLHKGYGTKLHLKLLGEYGPCLIHRQSFAPIRVLKKNRDLLYCKIKILYLNFLLLTFYF